MALRPEFRLARSSSRLGTAVRRSASIQQWVADSKTSFKPQTTEGSSGIDELVHALYISRCYDFREPIRTTVKDANFVRSHPIEKEWRVRCDQELGTFARGSTLFG